MSEGNPSQVAVAGRELLRAADTAATASASGDFAEALRALTACRELAAHSQTLVVAELRAAGMSWEAIGGLLGVHRVSARERFADRVDALAGAR